MSTWLERDDPLSVSIRRAWRQRGIERATRIRVEARLDAPDWLLWEQSQSFLAHMRKEQALGRLVHDPVSRELGERRQQSIDDAQDRPWTKTKPIYPIAEASVGRAIVSLITSLDFDPPLGGSTGRS